ncbi:CoA-binding protein [Candidatus Micrarchaeota archaeon]|nr:CoA-binding protein [Candidatus Micrarchaeota archaeon]
MPSIAIIGASNHPDKFGYKAVKAYLDKGWTVYPVNPKESDILGTRCYSTIQTVPGVPDFASLYIPPAVALNVLEDIARKGVKKVYFNPGTESGPALSKAKSLGLEPIAACSIRAIGYDPNVL